MGSESNSNNFYIDNNGINFLAAMGNCQFYPNGTPSAADVVATMSNSNDSETKTNSNGNPHQGHMNIANNNANMSNNSTMANNRNENESSAASNGSGTGNCNNGDGSNTLQMHSQPTNDDRIQNTYAHNSTVAPAAAPPPAQQSNALWNAFHSGRLMLN